MTRRDTTRQLRAELWTDKERQDHSGCTAIAAIVTPDTIVVANCGDSRSALATRVDPSGIVAMSDDHKPCNVGETERIKNAGGTVRAAATAAVAAGGVGSRSGAVSVAASTASPRPPRPT